MLERLRHFLVSEELTGSSVSAILRSVFATMFFAQTLLALVLGGMLRFGFASTPSSPLVAQILLGFSLLQLPLTLFLSRQATHSEHGDSEHGDSEHGGGRQAALSATLLSGVLLATPAWFLALALALGTNTLYLILFFAVLMSYYLIGFLLVKTFSNVALQDERKPEQARPTENS